MKAKDNPFAVERVLKVRYRPRGWTWEDLDARLKQFGYRAAIVGPEGSGKTTLLEELARRLREQGCGVRWLRLDREHPTFSLAHMGEALAQVSRQDIVLLDGSEQLGWWAWQRLRWRTRKAGGLLVTSHWRGRLPTLVETKPSLEVLEQIVRELLGDEPLRDDLAELFWRHQRNMRDVLRAMYDRWAEDGVGSGVSMKPQGR